MSPVNEQFNRCANAANEMCLPRPVREKRETKASIMRQDLIRCVTLRHNYNNEQESL